jgi:hypothetical protein
MFLRRALGRWLASFQQKQYASMHDQGGKSCKTEGGYNAPLCKQEANAEEEDGECEGAADSATQHLTSGRAPLKMMRKDG